MYCKYRFPPPAPPADVPSPGESSAITQPQNNQTETTTTSAISSFFHISSFVKRQTHSKCSIMASTEKRSDLIALARELNGVPMCDDYEKMISGMLCVSPISFISHPQIDV